MERNLKYILAIGAVALCVGVILSTTEQVPSAAVPHIPEWVIHIALVVVLVAAGLLITLLFAAVLYIERVLVRRPVMIIYKGEKSGKKKPARQLPVLRKVPENAQR